MDQRLWEATQALLDDNAPRPPSGFRSLLAGMLEDGHGRPMMAAHAIKAGRRYRCYVSRERDGQMEAPWRLPAGDLEAMVTGSVQRLLRDPLRMASELGTAAASHKLSAACAALADRLDDSSAMQAALNQLGATITVGVDTVRVRLGAASLLVMIGAAASQVAGDQRIELTISAILKRRGHEMRLTYAAPDANPAQRDDRLIKLIASGHEAYDRLRAGQGIAGPTERSTLTRLARLKFLAPNIITAIVEGRQPVELTSRSLLRIAELPLAWDEQSRMLGLA